MQMRGNVTGLLVLGAILLGACGQRILVLQNTPTSLPATKTPAVAVLPMQTVINAPEPEIIQPELKPDCAGEPSLTPPMTEGPYYTPDTPERTSLLEPGVVGDRLILSGFVLGRDCQPIAGAFLDFWQTDGNGVYDNNGYRLRGHQFTDEAGRYTLETVVPGLYPGRTRHIHVKVQAPGQSVLTTQLFFPDEPGNETEGIYLPELLLSLQDAPDGMEGQFNFILDVP